MLVLSLLMLLLIGITIVSIFWPKEDILNHFGLKFCLAFGIGSGITSIVYFFHTLFWGSSLKSAIISEALLEAALVAVLFLRKSKFNLFCKKNKENTLRKNNLNRVISISFFTTVFSSIVSFVIFSLKDPHGNWDAWFIWNVHARFIYRLNHLADFFKNCPDWSHPDYPQLVSALVARSWQYIGHERLIVSIIIAMLFTFGLVFLLSSSLSIFKSKNQGYLAGMIMLSTFTFIQQGATQCADIPIAFFFLATLILLSLKDKFNENSLLILAGIVAGISAWCKNEGLLFIISIFIARFIAILMEKGFKNAVKEIMLFFVGLFPVLAGIIYFKTLTPVNDLFLNQGINEIITRILTPARYTEIFSQFLITVKYYFGRLSGLPLLVLYALLVGVNVKKEYKTSFITTIIMLCLMITGYFGIYLITPHDLHWHLSTSLYRLLLQLWPCLLLLYFIIVKTPEEVLEKRQ